MQNIEVKTLAQKTKQQNNTTQLNTKQKQQKTKQKQQNNNNNKSHASKLSNDIRKIIYTARCDWLLWSLYLCLLELRVRI